VTFETKMRHETFETEIHKNESQDSKTLSLVCIVYILVIPCKPIPKCLKDKHFVNKLSRLTDEWLRSNGH